MRVVEFDAFSYDEALESVYIDKASDASIPFLSVSPIAFKYCNSLKEVNVNPERTDLISIDGVLYSINRENELAYTANNMYTMTEGNYVLIYYPSGKTDKEYIAPDKLELIGGYNISNKYLEKIVLNEGLRVTSSAQLRETAYLYSGFMDEASYEFANLKELIIPSTVIEADCKFETDGIDKAVNKSNVDVKMECRNSTVVCNRKFVSLTTGQESDGNSNHGIQVYIGNETPVESMKDCSVVTATYELQDGMKGTIGIIGPKRMDYEKVVETLKNMRTQLDDVFKKS